jgi:hypothetical protein
LSLVMMPCDWIGIVTIRSDTRWTWLMSGAKKISPGPRAPSRTLPRWNITARSYCFRMRTDSASPTSATSRTAPIT